MSDAYIKRILNARVYDVAHETPLTEAPTMTRRLGNQVFLKREDLQPVFSFKIRGALNRVLCLSPAERERGVVRGRVGKRRRAIVATKIVNQRTRTNERRERTNEPTTHTESLHRIRGS